MFGFRLRAATHMGDIGENKDMPGNPQLLVVLNFFHFDSLVDFAPPSQTNHL